jgi:hypothetical protein
MAQKILSVKANGTIRRNVHVKTQSTHSRTREILHLLGMDVKEYEKQAKLRMYMRMSENPNLNPSI